jgi:hypothetical protein
MEGGGQNVQQETPHKLVWAECHDAAARPLFAAVVLITERDPALVEREESRIGDGDAVSVARQIGQHGRRPGERALGVDDPTAVSKRFEPVGEKARISEPSILAKELQLTGTMRTSEFFEETASKQTREDADR